MNQKGLSLFCSVVLCCGVVSMGRDMLDLFSVNKWRCSWSLAATIASVLALVSVVHLVSFPLTPTLNNFKIAQDSCISANVSAEFPSKRDQEQPAVDFKLQFPADLHGAVVYQGAPWKAEIGHWLAGCDSVIKEVNMTEVTTDAIFNDFGLFLCKFLFSSTF